MKLVLALASISIGFAILKYLIPLAAVGGNDCPRVFTGIYPFDSLICLVLPVFKSLFKSNLNALIYKLLASTLISFFLVAGIESTRSTSKLFFKWFGLLVLLGHIVGISVALPIFWIPSMFYQPAPGNLNPKLNYIVLFFIGIFTAVCYSIETNLEHFEDGIIAFHLVSILMQPAWNLISFFIPNSNSFIEGSKSAQNVYNTCTAILGIWWISTITPIVRPYLSNGIQGIGEFLHLFWKLVESNQVEDQHGAFFLFDFLLLWFWTLVWIIYDQGRDGLQFIWWSFIVGPGAAITRQAAIREENLLLKKRKKE